MATTVPDSDPNKTPTSQQNRDHDSDTSVASTAVGPVSSKTSATLSSTTQQTTSDQHVTTTPGIIVQTSTPSSSQSSTFTTQMTTSKIFSAPSSTSSRTPSSSINWGPAITASPLPATETVGPDNNPNQPSAGFSSNSRNAVIISTTIGGTIILAFLFYALWRRRKGATYAEIVHFRPHSSTIILSPSRDRHLTALPIYRESRYSVRSSKQHGSTASFNKAFKRPSGVPSPIAEHFHKQNPWIQNMWKTGNPPTPTREKHPLSEVTSAPQSSQIKQPETARVASSYSAKSRMTKQSSGDTTKSGLAISIREASIEGEAGSPLDSPKPEYELQDRWSWTNSQAPPTPRMGYAPSIVSSRASGLPRFRNVTSWVRSQADHESNRVDEEQASPSRTKAIPSLKNKAWKPNLAPKPTRKLSKTNHRSKSSLSSSFKREADSDIPTFKLPEPARLDDLRTRTAPAPGSSGRL